MFYQLLIGNEEILRYGITFSNTVIHKIAIYYNVLSKNIFIEHLFVLF